MRTGIKHWFQPPVVVGADFAIRGIGLQERMPPCVIDRPVGTGDWLIMAFAAGALVRDAEGARLRERDCLIAWPPGARQHYGNEHAPFVHSWIHCDGAHVQACVRAAHLPENAVLPITDWSAMEGLLRLLHGELCLGNGHDAHIARDYFDAFLRTIARQGRFAPPVIPEAVQRIRMHMEMNCDEKMSLPRLARMAHCTPQHLCELFRRHVGLPPIEYLISVRVHQATHLLHDRNLRIQDIARRVGFTDIYYFSRLFKQRTGHSPRAMRQRLLSGQVSAEND